MSRVTVITATMATACLTAGASAITNPGFETGDTSGWTLTVPSGAWATVVTQHQGDQGRTYAPPEGEFFLLMKTDGPGSYTRAEQSVTLTAGKTLSGWAAFDAQDYLPFNDNARVQVFDSSGTLVATPWYSDVAAIGDFGDGPWTLWSWTAPAAGTYLLSYEVANSGDSVVDSYALFDGAISDSDEDGLDDSVDNCPDTPNPNQTDGDGDGAGDVCDNCLDTPNSGQEDSDSNGVGDCCEPDAPDCNGNGVPDACDIAHAASEDCNGNGIPDECDISGGSSQDCDGNGIPDECEEDCNGNGVADACDLAAGTSADCNGNGIPDECDLASGVSNDCQPNGVLDSCDIDLGNSQDCNANGVPDECDITSGASDDCQPNGIPDDCEWAAYLNQAGQGRSAGRSYSSLCQLPDQQMHGGAFVVPVDWELGTGAADSFTLAEATTITGVTWWGTYQDECGEPCEVADDFALTFYASDGGPASVVVATYLAGGAPTRSATGQTIPLGPGFAEYEYSFDLVPPLSVGAGQRHWVEIRNNTAASCMWWWETSPEGANGNGTSLYDAAGDGYDDGDLVPYDLAFCVSGLPAAEDCNGNGVNDAQDIFDGTSQDCQPNGIPDECEDDGNYNGIPDTCDIVSGVSKDLNFNSLPDEADCLTTPGDLDSDCDVERDDYALFAACMGTSGADILAGCVCADFDLNGTVDFADYLAFSAAAGQPVVGCRIRPADACPDSWTTAGGGGGGGRVSAALQEEASFYDFGLHGPIPAGFFAEGSDPFGEVVTFVGTPADPSGVYGDIDTQIQHGPVIFDPETGEAQTTLYIITLDLISKDPIMVTYNGGQDPEQWLVVAGLSPHDPGSGELTATLDDPDANTGTYDATVYVQPAFLFVKRQDLIDHVLPECVTARVLDTGESGAEPLGASVPGRGSVSAASTAMPPITLSFTGQPFVRVADPTIVEQLSVPDCAQGNFVPGVIEAGGGGRAAQQLTCTSHITPGEAHYFCPPECEGEDVCKYTASGPPTPLGACTQLPTFPQAILGTPCPSGVSQCASNRVKHRPCPGGGSAFQTYANPACVSRESTCDGACCNDQGHCAMSTNALCAGTYQGDGTTCSPNLCCSCSAVLGDATIEPGNTVNVTCIITNTSSAADCTFNWSVTKTTGTPTVNPNPPSGTVTLAAGASFNAPLPLTVPANTAARDDATMTLDVTGDGTCSDTGTVCIVPTDETSTCLGWNPNAGWDIATFSGTLTPATADFSTRTVTEDPVGSGTGTTDTCWFQGSALSQYTNANSISGGTWTVGANNTWQTDNIGIPADIDAYYTAQGRTPCALHTVQHMKMVCPSGNVEYTTNSFDWDITANGTTISRDGVSCTPPH